MKINKKGFTLIEMLVVVLIIGILAGIALPQYKMAVTKAKVASILPLMRRWKDALIEYKLQHGSYMTEDDELPDASDLGVNWPTDWTLYNGNPCGNNTSCKNDYWNCHVNLESTGTIDCGHADGNNEFAIFMYQYDDPEYEDFRDKITCYSDTGGRKVCKALGGKLVGGYTDEWVIS